ncbi:sugar transferase [Tautonia sociabilis]|uniref:Sugar transferase n=1 Tax=Tautonia sociabilis TaxID=2080755 RepID=A0A432MIL8_9BACT|nr:sugar transferase [Tautonia sociabilis]RUL87077.1 sugar transferase [Tautonia sociabilis]
MSPLETIAPPRPARRAGSSYEAIKRAIDVLAALAGLLVIGPLLLAIGLAVLLSSPGPVFYRGVRTGKDGRPFRIYKFRSMVVDAESLGGTTTGKGDPRITRVGAVLRRYKLDELPQLLNVLAGDMSLVGPRPEVAEYTDAYTEDERRILSVRPGITDLACLEFGDLQEVVGGDDPDGTFRALVLPRKNALRLRYVEERSLGLDLAILARTALLVLSKPFRGASPRWRGPDSAPTAR